MTAKYDVHRGSLDYPCLPSRLGKLAHMYRCCAVPEGVGHRRQVSDLQLHGPHASRAASPHDVEDGQPWPLVWYALPLPPPLRAPVYVQTREESGGGCVR